MKILLTGSTASHSPNTKDQERHTFAFLLNKALVFAGNDVTWINSSVSLTKEYLEDFDSVIVGISPPTSLSSNRAYGALSVIDYAHSLNNLTLFVDSPNPKMILSSINSIIKAPDTLVKPFYAKRKDYKKATDTDINRRLMRSLNMLYTEKWPTTIYPELPWSNRNSLSDQINNVSSDKSVGVNYDSILLDNLPYPVKSLSNENTYWVADSLDTSWTRDISKVISYEIVSARKSYWEKYEEVVLRINNSTGCLISIQKDLNTSWTPYLSYSLNNGVPVVPDWKISGVLGDSWNNLPHYIEEMSASDRQKLAFKQKESYRSNVLSWEKSVELTNNAVERE
jgi:hypothetical protein